MTRARVVIGANFGDEGKGLMTDYHVAALGGSNVVVCRFNGGAQAGHTVVTPDGRRHVFSHFGSGTLQDAETFLSEHFVVNPLLYVKEARLLSLMGTRPRVTIDPRAALSTPFDMLINQAAEAARGDGRHGSCGVGINETVTRCGTEYATSFEDVWHLMVLREKLEFIRDEYLPRRLNDFGISGTVSPAMELLSNSDGLIEQYLDAVRTMRSLVKTADATLLRSWNVVFEGAQGLLLDQNHHYFPHVTRSNTGLTNVLEIAHEAGIDSLDVTYVTRSYVTRHGAGPFETEDSSMLFEDNTNVRGPWQGQLRFGRLDEGLLIDTIRADLTRVTEIDLVPNLAVTHLDQRDAGLMPLRVAEAIGADQLYTSYGPTRRHVTRSSC